MRCLGLVLGMILVVALGGCSKPPAQPTKEPFHSMVAPPPPPKGDAHKKLTFAIIPKQKDNPVFAYAKIGAETQGRALGIDIKWDAPNANDEAKQAELLSSFAEQGVDGIAVSCSNPDTLKPAIDKAVDKGVPVICWDSDSPNSKRKAFYGIDDYATGKLLGKELLALLPKGGTVMILSGVQGAQNLEQRVKGAKEMLESTAGVNAGVKVLGVQYCRDDLTTAVQIVGDVMGKTPDLAGWIFVGGWPLFAKNGLDAIDPAKTKVVSVDPLPEAQKWIENGKVQVCVGQKVFGWGKESVNLLFALARGMSVQLADSKGFVDSGVDVVVKAREGVFQKASYIPLADYRKSFEQQLAGN